MAEDSPMRQPMGLSRGFAHRGADGAARNE